MTRTTSKTRVGSTNAKCFPARDFPQRRTDTLMTRLRRRLFKPVCRGGKSIVDDDVRRPRCRTYTRRGVHTHIISCDGRDDNNIMVDTIASPSTYVLLYKISDVYNGGEANAVFIEAILALSPVYALITAASSRKIILQ